LDADDLVMPLEVVNTILDTEIGPATVRGACSDRYSSAASSIDTVLDGGWTAPGWLSDLMIPHAKSLLCIFRDGNTDDVQIPYLPSGSANMEFNAFHPGYFSEWLTHNAGATFNDAGAATIKEYHWDTTNSLANLVANAPQIKDALTSYYNQVVYPQVASYFATQVVGTVAYFPSSITGYEVPHESESQPWVSGCTLTFNTWWPDLVDDTNGTVGRGRLLEHRARYRVEKKLVSFDGYTVVYLAVTQIQSWGEMIDLYDFNHDAGGKSRDAAILQLGFGNGGYGSARTRGQIFRTRVQFNKTYEALP
jgi:hypothetical protein